MVFKGLLLALLLPAAGLAGSNKDLLIHPFWGLPASTAAVMPAQSGISPPATGQVRSGFVAMSRAPRFTAWSAVLSLA